FKVIEAAVRLNAVTNPRPAGAGKKPPLKARNPPIITANPIITLFAGLSRRTNPATLVAIVGSFLVIRGPPPMT
ncbi:MAG: hypothetical protein ACE5KO_03555, partial [Candidatus Bathyarchaeia archaeon]